MPLDLDELSRHLQALINSVKIEDELSEAQLKSYTDQALRLLQEVQRIAADINEQDLEEFLEQIAILLPQVDQEEEQERNRNPNAPPPSTIYQRISKLYADKIQPMVDDHIVPVAKRLEKMGKAPTSNAAKFDIVTDVAGEILNCCRDLNTYRPHMDYKEKKYAALGTLLMMGGVAILIAAHLNPVVPAITGLIAISVGVYFARKAVYRHKANLAAQQINTQLDSIEKKTAELKPEPNKMTKRTLTFGQRGEATEQAEEEKPPIGLIQRFKNAYKALVNPGEK